MQSRVKSDRNENSSVPTGTSERGKQRPKARQRLREWLRNEWDYSRPRRWEVREATILDIGENDMVVDIGAKHNGIVLRKDLDLLDEPYRDGLSVGDRVPVMILRTWGNRDGIVVSINKGLQNQDWLRASDLLESEEVVELEVVGINRGGILVQFGQLRGFVPNSHLVSMPRGLERARLKEAKSALMGQMLRLMVIDVNQRRRRLVLSERKANQVRRQQVLDELTEGDVRSGTVTSLVDFGAFVDIGSIDGLIHISELSWGHVDHPSEVLQVGDRVEVYVLSVDRERERIGLSRRRLLPDPWYAVTDALQVGNAVQGTVTNVVDFGAFVDLGQGVEGLVHISETPAGEATLGSLEPGSTIGVRVLEIDHDRRRISLSLRGVAQELPLSEPSTAWQEGNESTSGEY
jgi:small subunit ribosomal protein S1